MDPSHLVPAQRAPDADREAASEALRAAAADGRLTLEEMEHRMAAVFAAKTHPEIDVQLADLQGRQDVAPQPPGPVFARWGDTSGPEIPRTLTVMGDNTRSGFWRPAAHSRVITVMGDATIDFSDADLSRPITHLRVVTVMGDTTIEVPDDINVHVTKSTILGDAKLDLPARVPIPGAPELHIRLLTVLGSARVRCSRIRRRPNELYA